jgi:hypothetical protein
MQQGDFWRTASGLDSQNILILTTMSVSVCNGPAGDSSSLFFIYFF